MYTNEQSFNITFSMYLTQIEVSILFPLVCDPDSTVNGQLGSRPGQDFGCVI